MQKDAALIENELEQNIYCVPQYALPKDNDQISFKRDLLVNKSLFYLKKKESKKLFGLQLCSKDKWNRLVDSDSLLVYVYDEDNLIANEQILGNYIGVITVRYENLKRDNCTIKINEDSMHINRAAVKD